MIQLEQAFRSLDQGDLKTAEVGFRGVLQKDPANGKACWGLARVATLTGQKDVAIKLYARCCRCLPGEPEPLIALGEALSARNRFIEAKAAFTEAVEANPDYASAHYVLGLHLIGAGNSKQARLCLRKALELQPEFAHAWEALGRIVAFDPGGSDLQKIAALAEERDIPLKSQVALQYALGKAHDDRQNSCEAFHHWTLANKLQLSACAYRVADMQPFFSRLTESFDSATTEAADSVAGNTLIPIFIVGQPRSGSTLLEQLLLNHSKIASAGETGFLGNEIATRASDMTGKPFPDSCAALSLEKKQQLAAEYLSFLARYRRGASHVIDKLPANYQSIGFIRSLLPQAHIVHLYRNPVETCFSIFRQHFVAIEPFFCTLPEIVAYHRQYQAVMRHWHHALPGLVTDIQYENLAANPESAVRKILSLCGLPWEQACAELPTEPRHIPTLSATQARTEILSPDKQRRALDYKVQITDFFSGFTDEDWQ
jgi:Tfp pilus assembly protein PilF